MNHSTLPATPMQNFVPQPHFDRDGVRMYLGDCRELIQHLPSESVQCCVTSPPYWGLRDYGHDDQIGLEQTPNEYIETMVNLFRDVRRVLKDDGTLWLNLGDTYATGTFAERKQSTNPGVGANRPESQNSVARVGTPIGLKTKDLIGIPWRVALALQADGWWLRQDIIWHKPNPMPESVTDRCTKSHEYIFLLSKSERYFFDSEGIKEPMADTSKARMGRAVSATHKNIKGAPGQTPHTMNQPRNRGDITDVAECRNKRSVWSVTLKPYKGAHFATYPQELIEPCIKAGCPEGGTVLDPFIGSGTTAAVAQRFGRKFVGFELNPKYLALAEKRFVQRGLPFDAA